MLTYARCCSSDKDKISDFELKLMDIDSEHLAIPELETKCQIKMPSAEFQRICRDLAVIGDTVSIHASKEGVKFSVSGDLGTGNITLRPTSSTDEVRLHHSDSQGWQAALTRHVCIVSGGGEGDQDCS